MSVAQGYQAGVACTAPAPTNAKPPAVQAESLRRFFFRNAPVPPRDNRTRYGRALNLDRIEQALRNAQNGAMRDITDLSRETIDTDPHLAAVLAKRFGSLTVLPWEVIPAKGEGVDPAKAEKYATLVREQLSKLPRFGNSIERLAWGLFDGRAALEIDWRVVGNNQFEVTGLGWIHPRRIQFGPERELRVHDMAVTQGFQPLGIALRDVPYKFIEFTPQLFGDYPEREGLGPRCLYWSFFKRFAAREQMILLEQFGKPWRVIHVDEESTADPDDLAAADEIAENLPFNSSGRMPRGTTLDTFAPNRAAGQMHDTVIGQADAQISKLVLGQTGTTDGTAAGMNSSQAFVMRGEQDLIRDRDAHMLSEALEDFLTDAIIAVNFGEEELPNAPRFRLRSDVPADRLAEVQRVRAAVEAGLSVAINDAYEVSGFRQPLPEEPVIKLDTPPTHPMSVQPAPPRPVVIYPKDKAPEPGVQVGIAEPAGGLESPTAPADPNAPAEPQNPIGDSTLELTPSDLAQIVTVNEARESVKLPKLTLPDGSPDPDGELTIAEFRAKKEAKGESAGTEIGTEEGREETGKPPLPDTPPAPAFPGGGPPAGGPPAKPEAPKPEAPKPAFPAITSKPMAAMLSSAGFSESDSVRLSALAATPDPVEVRYPDPIRLAKQVKTVHGSVDRIINIGVPAGAAELRRWVEHYARAVDGKDSPAAIDAALRGASDDVVLARFAVHVERTITRGLMLGALDSRTERGELKGAARDGFDDMPYADAIKYFRAKSPVTKDIFERLRIAAKRRSFTVAGKANDRMVQTFQREIVRHVAEGKQFRDFRKAVEERADFAGWTPANPSHVETIYRTNVLDAYNSGRIKEMTQPAVAAARPYWQWRAVADNRSRETHKEAHLKVLRADDPFWATSTPPCGFNCRCRLVSLSAAEVKSKGLEVTTGAAMPEVLDPGFVSGTSALIAGDA